MLLMCDWFSLNVLRMLWITNVLLYIVFHLKVIISLGLPNCNPRILKYYVAENILCIHSNLWRIQSFKKNGIVKIYDKISCMQKKIMQLQEEKKCVQVKLIFQDMLVTVWFM